MSAARAIATQRDARSQHRRLRRRSDRSPCSLGSSSSVTVRARYDANRAMRRLRRRSSPLRRRRPRGERARRNAEMTAGSVRHALVERELPATRRQHRRPARTMSSAHGSHDPVVSPARPRIQAAGRRSASASQMPSKLASDRHVAAHGAGGRRTTPRCRRSSTSAIWVTWHQSGGSAARRCRVDQLRRCSGSASYARAHRRIAGRPRARCARAGQPASAGAAAAAPARARQAASRSALSFSRGSSRVTPPRRASSRR